MYETEREVVYETSDFQRDLPILIEKIKGARKERYLPTLSPVPEGGFDGVYGIPAGGLVLAVCLHYRLGLPLLLAPTVKTLVVDDIADYGRSLSHYAQRGMFILTLFYHRHSCCAPNIWLHEKDDKWIRFELWEGMEG